jgi:hypothetical protein
VINLEFWPDYGPGPLWSADGQPADLAALPLGDELRQELVDWNADYREDRIPVEGPGDPDWLREGTLLLGRVRDALSPGFEVAVTEPWWGE